MSGKQMDGDVEQRNTPKTSKNGTERSSVRLNIENRVLIVIGAVLMAISIAKILDNSDFSDSGQKAVGHIESIASKSIKMGKGGMDTLYFLKINYVAPSLGKTISVTVDNNDIWGPDMMVTFLYKPNDPETIRFMGYENLYAKYVAFFVIGVLLFVGGFIYGRDERK